MNCIRCFTIPATGCMLSGLFAMLVLVGALASVTWAASPYYGEPIMETGRPARMNHPPGGAPTLRVGGRGNSADLDRYFRVPGGGEGIEARIGHIVGETVGRDDSLTHFDLMPYLFVEDHMFFGDFRLYRLNEGTTGVNAGAGWRHYFADHDMILTAAGYYDYDDTRAQEFDQVGLSLEVLSRWLDVRANWYVPINEKELNLGTDFVRGSQQYQGNLLLTDTITFFEDAAEGVDLTLTTPIPWDFLQPYNVEASAGFYHFQRRDKKLPQLWGYRFRADASFFDRMLHTFVDVTTDRQHDTTFALGVSLNYYAGFESRNRLQHRQLYRMSEWVRRNYTVVGIKHGLIDEDVPVINPLDEEPYIFVHIANNPPFEGFQNGMFGAPGDAGGPVETFAAAFGITEGVDDEGLLQPVDAYIVHGGSEFTGGDAVVEVPEGKILLGQPEVFVNTRGQLQAINPQVLPAQLGRGSRNIQLPLVRADMGVPVLRNSAGSAIDATNALLVGAFEIINPDSHGLLVEGVSSVSHAPYFLDITDINSRQVDPDINQLFRDLLIRGAEGDGVRFENVEAEGGFVLERVRVRADDSDDGVGGNGAMGVAFHIIGGMADIRSRDILPPGTSPPPADEDATFQNAPFGTPPMANLNPVVLIENTAAGFVDLLESSISDDGGGGIRLMSNAGDVRLGQSVLLNTAATGITSGGNRAGLGDALEIFGASGSTTIARDVTIMNPGNRGLLVDSLAQSGRVFVQFDNAPGQVLPAGQPRPGVTIDIQNRNGIGAHFTNIMGVAATTGVPVQGVVRFEPTAPNATGSMLMITGLGATGGTGQDAAVKFDSSSGLVALNQVLINGSNAEGILIGDYDLTNTLDPNSVIFDADGLEIGRPRFDVTGDVTILNVGSAGNIPTVPPTLPPPAQVVEGTAAISIQGQDDPPVFNFQEDDGVMDEDANVNFLGLVDIDNRTERGIQIIRTSGGIRFNGLTAAGGPGTVVQNALSSQRAALHIRRTVSDISLAGFRADEAMAGEPAVEIQEVWHPGSVRFGRIEIEADGNEADDPTLGERNPMVGIAADTTGFFARFVNRLVIGEGTIEVEDGTAVDIQHVYPQYLAPNPMAGTGVRQWLVRDEDGALVALGSLAGFEPDDPDNGYIVQGRPDMTGMIVFDPNLDLDGLQRFDGYTVELDTVMSEDNTLTNFGIYLEDNVGTFAVNGGLIEDTTIAGLFALDADRVFVSSQTYEDNFVGLEFREMNETDLQGARIQGSVVNNSVEEAIFAENVRNLTISGMTFDDNGSGDRNPLVGALDFADTILIRASQQLNDPNDPPDLLDPDDDDNPYLYQIVENTFQNKTAALAADEIRIETFETLTESPDGAVLDLDVFDNTFLAFRPIENLVGGTRPLANGGPREDAETANLLSVFWDGSIIADVERNTGQIIGTQVVIATLVNPIDPNRQGFEFIQDSRDDASIINVSENQLTFSNVVETQDPASTGAFFEFRGQVEINVEANQFLMGTSDGSDSSTRGLFFELRNEDNLVTLTNNAIQFFNGQPQFNGDGTGIGVVGNVFGSARFAINGNQIGTNTPNGFAQLGFDFRGSTGTVLFQGNVLNTVFAEETFQPLPAPPNFMGQFNINGVFGP